MEMTREQFTKELAALEEDKNKFNVESEDSGSIYLSFYGCKIETTLEDGICGEIVMFKPYTEMEVRLDFDIIAAITKEDDGSYRLEMDHGMPDVVIRNVA